jgi:hypothetical protein
MPPRIEIPGVREQHARSWRRHAAFDQARIERSLRRDEISSEWRTFK